MPEERDVQFTGESEMKGRNGYTKLGSANKLSVSGGDQCYISFYSPRPRGGVGTALLCVNREDFQRFKTWVAGLEFDDTRSPREKEIGSIAFAAEQAASRA